MAKKKRLEHPAVRIVAMSKRQIRRRVRELKSLGADASSSKRIIDIELRMYLFLLGKKYGS